MTRPRALFALAVALLLAAGWVLTRQSGARGVDVAQDGAALDPESSDVSLAPIRDATTARENVATAPAFDPEAVRPTRVEVVVVDHRGAGLPGVTVRLATPGPWGSWKDLREGVTDAEGVAAFGDYARDGLWAEVVAETLPPGHVPSVRVFGSLETSDDARLVLECPGSARIEGRVTDANGAPLSEWRVRLAPVDFDSDALLVETRHDGTFVVDEAHPGTWSASIRFRDRRALVGTSLPSPLRVAVRPGETARVDLALRDRGATIIGRVVSRTGDPVAGVLVRAGAAHPDGREGNLLRGDGTAFAMTDDDGRYALGPLAEGEYAVRVGDSHGSDHVTRDRVLFVEWPDDFIARAGDAGEHVTEVDVVERTIEWKVRPIVSASLARALGADPREIRAKVGWCRLFLDESGAWRFVTARRDRAVLVVVGLGDAEWRIELEEPRSDVVERVLEIPPR